MGFAGEKGNGSRSDKFQEFTPSTDSLWRPSFHRNRVSPKARIPKAPLWERGRTQQSSLRDGLLLCAFRGLKAPATCKHRSAMETIYHFSNRVVATQNDGEGLERVLSCCAEATAHRIAAKSTYAPLKNPRKLVPHAGSTPVRAGRAVCFPASLRMTKIWTALSLAIPTPSSDLLPKNFRTRSNLAAAILPACGAGFRRCRALPRWSAPRLRGCDPGSPRRRGLSRR